MAFRVGQKVVCIFDGWQPPLPIDRKSLPIKGEIYTISEIITNSQNIVTLKTNNIITLNFFELGKQKISIHGNNFTLCFDQKYFRPLVSRETDISVFKEILLKNSIKKTEDA